MDVLMGIAVITGVWWLGAALTEWAKRGNKGVSSRDIKQMMKEMQCLREEIAALRGKGETGAAGRDITSRLDRLQEEVTALRDTTTQFDMSFDAAMDRLERRVEGIEARTLAATDADRPQVLRQR